MNVITIDRDAGTITVDGKAVSLDSAEGFEILSDAWLDAGLRIKHPYTFTWLGRPVIQFADDLLRLQELVYSVRPDVIVETGIAHGGSLIFHASLCKMLGTGRVIGVDVEIRPHNRAAIEAHPLAPLITLIEGSSVDSDTISAVKALIQPEENALVILDSNHTKAHVAQELEAYAPLVKPGSYIVALDGHIMEVAAGRSPCHSEQSEESPDSGDSSPSSRLGMTLDWATNNPNTAVRAFAETHPEFVLEGLPLPFNESILTRPVSGFLGGLLKRIR